MVCTYDESLVILRDFFVFVERTENKVCYLCLQSPNILDVKRPIGLTFQQTATKQTTKHFRALCSSHMFGSRPHSYIDQ